MRLGSVARQPWPDTPMTTPFEAAFAALRARILAAAPQMTVARDEAGALELRTPQIDPKTGQPGWFGTVTVRKSYVAVHLMPLYADPALAADLSPALARRRQGKTCFNVSKVDDALFAELEGLMRRCAALPAANADTPPSACRTDPRPSS